jgi:REP element-mobilizing transposase RayT
MTRARNQLISLETTPYYHCISRCVRRAFLWGEDSLTGNNYEHRKVWVTSRLRELAEVFAIDICAYAVMSNHYHLVLRVDVRKAEAWDTAQVIERWSKLYNPPCS